MTDDLSRLVHDLTVEGERIAQDIRASVSKGALNIKREWRERARGIEHAPRYPQSITYSMKGNAYFSAAEIGPEDNAENQGFLGPILEFGGAHNAPRNDGQQALDAEAPRFERAIHELAGKQLA